VPGRARPFFAHLKLRGKSIEAHAFDNSPTIKALPCARGFQRPAALSVLSSTALTARHC
jgi:hypothetical protein